MEESGGAEQAEQLRKAIASANTAPGDPTAAIKKEMTHLDFVRNRPDGVTLVRDKATAKKVVEKLRTLTDRFHACDTEAIEIDMNRSSVGQGKVCIFSVHYL